MALPLLVLAASGCVTDEDCNLSGRCASGTCSCLAGWVGDDCGKLNLAPMDAKQPPAYGKMPTATQEGLASWGGSIVRDPSDAERWHLFASEMSHGCGLDAWGRNSAIVHATANNPMGPYERQKELLPYFAHEPTVVTLPGNAGYVIYKIGCADGAVTGSNGTGLVGPCTQCRNGTTDGGSSAKDPDGHPSSCPAPTQAYETTCQDALHASSLDGPWKRVPLNMSGWDWTNVNLGLESMAPVVLENGTLLTLTRSWGTPQPYPNSAFWLVKADSWDGRYYKVPDAPQPFLNVTMEDSFMFQDELGHFHAIFHAWAVTNVGAHAFSRDGLHWTLPPRVPLARSSRPPTAAAPNMGGASGRTCCWTRRSGRPTSSVLCSTARCPKTSRSRTCRR